MTNEVEASWKNQQRFSFKSRSDGFGRLSVELKPELECLRKEIEGFKLSNGFGRLITELRLARERLERETEELKLDTRRTERRNEATKIKFYLGCLAMWALIILVFIKFVDIDLLPIFALLFIVEPMTILFDINGTLKKLVDA